MPSPARGIMLPRDLDAARVFDFARLVDDLGFDEIWVVEDLAFRGGIAQAAAVLASTPRIRVGIGILPAAVRNVAFEAMELATLAQLFPGRLDIGIGHGMPGWLRAVGAWPERPLQFLEAHVRALRALLNGETVTADGRVVLDDVALDPSARPDVVPDILLGVRGPRSLAVSGRIADGTVLAEPATPEYVRAARDQIAGTRPHRIVAYNVAAVADRDAEAVAVARPGLEWIGEPDWAPHIAPLPFAEDFAALRARSSTRAEFVTRMPDEWVAQLALAGTPSTVAARVSELGAAGVTSSVMIPVGPDAMAAARSLARAL
jgi:5,10-methylenetetrahydromethanopterin reductase